MSIESMFTYLSAKLGNKHDLYRLGVNYYTGENVNRDYAQAKKYLEKAANKRLLKALYYLGIMQRDGNECKPDFALALRYFELSKREEELAHESIVDLEKEIFELEKNEENAELLFKIGYMYANDNAISKDYEKAIQYYKRAASYGNNHAKNQLGLAFAFGRLNLDKNMDNALTYLYSAVRNGFYTAKQSLYQLFEDHDQFINLKQILHDNCDAQNIYASMCYEGINTIENHEEAKKYFELAAEKEHSDAIFSLYLLTQKDNLEISQNYLQHALRLNHLEAKKIALENEEK